MSGTDDPFGRRGDERTDAFGRPIEEEPRREGALWSGGDPPEEEPREASSRREWAPPGEGAAPGETAAPGEGATPREGAAPPGASQRGGFRPPTDSPPGGFRPPTDSPADGAGWWAEAQPDAPAQRGPDAAAPRAGRPADWSARLGAALLDFVVRGAIVLVAGIAGFVIDAAGSGLLGGLLVVLGFAASFAYAPWMIATRDGQTLGHRATGTRIVMARGGRVSGGLAFVREVLIKGILVDGLLLWILVGFLNYLWPLWDENNEALHDKMCGTRVVSA